MLLCWFCSLKGSLEFHAGRKEHMDSGSSHEIAKVTLKGLSSCKDEQLGPWEMPEAGL